MIKVGMLSLGCAKNLVDSEMILGMFPRDGYSIVSDPKKADLIIVNTCGFIASAKEESINSIMEMCQYGAKIVVTGCLAERYLEELKASIHEADAIVPIREYKDLHKVLNELLGSSDVERINPLKRVVSTSFYSAYLRISDGCNNFCAFCAIPFIRGRFRSRPFEEIIEEARQLKESGIKEISLISQDTTIYGLDFEGRKPDIVDLLKALEEVGFYSIRLLYLYPSEISDELIDFISSSKVVSHYFDIPVQTASNRMLSAMKRHANKEETYDVFRRIREKCPDAILRTTLIAGFPGESEEDHQEALKMLQDIRFDHMGCFTYSREEGTAAYRYEGQVHHATKKRRQKELMKLQAGISYSNNKKHIGEVMEGLVISKKSSHGLYSFRSYWNAPDDIDGFIYFSSPLDHKEGDIVRVKITSCMVYDLHGEEVIEN